jgi:NhaP-type Na+/H+ or K+/H+ antiporter
MTLLFTFILFGSSLIWQGLLVLNGTTLLFAIVVVLIRPVAFFVSLFCTNLDSRSRLLIAWFGPRGLSSLLLILVPVFGAVPGTEPLFVICCLVVLLSVALHGSSLMLLGREEPPAAASANQIPATIPSSNPEGPRRQQSMAKAIASDGRPSRVTIRRRSGADRGRPRRHELQLQ